jgi:protein SCO1/2
MNSQTRRLRLWIAEGVFMLLLVQVAAAATRPLDDSSLASIRFEQRLRQPLSLALRFTDESGSSVALQDYFREKPVLIVPGYYGCPMLCGQVANGLIEAMQDVKVTPGRDFEMLFVSINPAETSQLAADKKRTYLKRYGRAESRNGWHFLTGSDSAIQTLSSELGFHYAYDPLSKQYAHPSGIVIVRPDGVIAQYLFGVTYSPGDLNQAVKAAAKGEVQSPIKQLLLLCFHYTPLTGKHAAFVIGLVRTAALTTLFALAAVLFVMARRPRRTSA